ncbi:MAG: DUF4430 domain-containing protein, partial [Clostridia bacterium]
MTNFKKKLFLSAMVFALIAVIALTFASCEQKKPNVSGSSGTISTISADSATSAVSKSEESSPKINEVGQGEKNFTFEVVLQDGSKTNFAVKTNEKTVGAALVALKLIDGEDGEYGLYVKTVNGTTVDYDTDKAYWAFYVNGAYASSGVDKTDI